MPEIERCTCYIRQPLPDSGKTEMQAVKGTDQISILSFFYTSPRLPWRCVEIGVLVFLFLLFSCHNWQLNRITGEHGFSHPHVNS